MKSRILIVVCAWLCAAQVLGQEVEDYLRFVPSGSHLVLDFIPGVEGKHNLRDRVLISGTAHLLMVGLTAGTKAVVSRERPDGSDHHSFYSGHVATAFTGAELLRREYGWVYGGAGYAVATSVAVLRVAHKRHYVGDVLMGAGVGVLSAEVGFWMLPVWQRWFKLDDSRPERKVAGTNVVVMATPYYDAEYRGGGVAGVVYF